MRYKRRFLKVSFTFFGKANGHPNTKAGFGEAGMLRAGYQTEDLDQDVGWDVDLREGEGGRGWSGV